MDSTAITMEAFLNSVGEFFTKSISWLGEVLDTIIDHPALLVLVIAMPVCSFAIGMLGRLIRM